MMHTHNYEQNETIRRNAIREVIAFLEEHGCGDTADEIAAVLLGVVLRDPISGEHPAFKQAGDVSIGRAPRDGSQGTRDDLA